MIDAAQKVISEDGYESLTVRRVAGRLGTSPMAIYRHVHNKDDLIAAVADRELLTYWLPRASTDNWRAWIAELNHRFRGLLVRQPAVMHVFLQHPVATPGALQRFNAIMAVLENAGFDRTTALRTLGALHTYTIGFAALETARARWALEGHAETEAQRELAGFTSAEQFTYGLDLLLDAIGHLLD